VVDAKYPAHPWWEWDITFKETGGKSNCLFSGKGCIHDPNGGIWAGATGLIYRGKIWIPAGGKDSSSYWCSSWDHAMCNGCALFTCEGKDDAGNTITVEEKVLLRHKDCPGPKSR
jgi:hypothetical protein